MKEALEGTVEKIIYENEDNGYVVLAFTSGQELITASGVLPGVSKGRRYQLEGEWKVHPKYGSQFAFSSFTELPPDSLDSIVAFLASGAIKGIGLKHAEAIVRHFKEDTLRVISEEPARLLEVAGIGKKKQEAIVNGYADHKAYADTVMTLNPFGLSPAMCLKLYKRYGSGAVDLVRTNPYQLIEDIDGFGFVSADKIANKLGIAKEDEHRIKSGIMAGLSSIMEEGSSYAIERDFVEDVARNLDVSRDLVRDAIDSLALDMELVKEKLDDVLIVSNWHIREAEQNAAAKLYMLSHSELKHISGNAENMISKTEKNTGVILSDQQKHAVISSVKNGVSVITGGPGTGKTTIINTIIAILKNADVKAALAAPTGRAAKRMSQATGENASTIHRLLEAAYVESEKRMVFGRDEENPIDAECVIVDEMSMVDIYLFSALLDALKPGTRLILVGDADQLPSVGPGSVLKDIIESETISCSKLTEIFRQAAESAIVVNAHAINRGEYPSYNEKNTDFFFMERGNASDALELIKDLCSKRLPSFYSDIDKLSDIQVLCPMKKEILGTRNLNKELQAVLNPSSPGKAELEFGDKVFRQGDKVIQIKNDYMLEWKDLENFEDGSGVFNGDIGIVSAVDVENGKISVLYDDNHLASYDFSNMDEIEPAYALTVHKSQGCEFPVVVLPCFNFLSILTTRNLLYTAVTRAKTAVVLVGNPKVCNAMVDNNAITTRNSGLKARLRRVWEFNIS